MSALRLLFRSVASLVGAVLALLGMVGLALVYAPPEAGLTVQRGIEVASATFERLAGQDVATPWLVAQLTAGFTPFVLLGAGVVIFVLLSLGSGRASTRREPAADANTRAPEPTVDRGTRRRAEKEADGLLKSGHLRHAAETLIEAGRLDRAVEILVRAEEFVRAAEVRREQNRPAEAAELFERAGRFESAGGIYVQQGELARAAEAYVKAGRFSVAAELFEKQGDHRKAADAYTQVGFHRHAAQAYVRCQQWEKAAASLEQVIAEEGQRLGGQDTRKQKELRTLVLQAGKLFEQAGKPDRAETVLERGGCVVAAAEMAMKLEHFAKAARLFESAAQPMRAADALDRIGEKKEAARLRGEYLRDQGDEEAAARCLEESGDLAGAGDLLRRLERYAEAASCYERQGDSAAAAEMFRLAGDPLRAAGAYEKADLLRDAAACYGEAGELRRQADLLARAGEHLAAGEIYHREGLDDEAIKVLQRVEPGVTGFGQASALLGSIFRAKGMHSLSIKKLRQAIGDTDLSRENVDAYYTLANGYELAEEWSEAVEIYEKIMAFDYHFSDVETRLRRSAREGRRGGSSRTIRRLHAQPPDGRAVGSLPDRRRARTGRNGHRL